MMKKELYKTILKSYSQKVINCVELGQTQAFLSVPAFVMGFPTFDRSSARTYLSRQLRNLGYDVTNYGQHDIYVSWVKSSTKETADPSNQLPVFANLHKVAESFRKQNR